MQDTQMTNMNDASGSNGTNGSGSNHSNDDPRSVISRVRENLKGRKDYEPPKGYKPASDPTISFFSPPDQPETLQMTQEEIKQRYFFPGIPGLRGFEKEWSLIQDLQKSHDQTRERLRNGIDPGPESKDYWDIYKDTDRPVSRAHFNEYREHKENEERLVRYIALDSCAKAERANNSEAKMKAKYEKLQAKMGRTADREAAEKAKYADLQKDLTEKRLGPLGPLKEPQIDLETGRPVQPVHKWLYPEDLNAIIVEADVNTELTGARNQWSRDNFVAMQQRAERAIKLAEQLKFEPLIARCHYYQGIALVKQKQFKEAEHAFDVAWKCLTHYSEGASLDEWRKRLREAQQLDASSGNSLVESKPKGADKRPDKATKGRLNLLTSPTVGERPGIPEAMWGAFGPVGIAKEPSPSGPPRVMNDVNTGSSSPAGKSSSSGILAEEPEPASNVNGETNTQNLVGKSKVASGGRASGLNTDELNQRTLDVISGKPVGQNQIRVKEVLEIEKATAPEHLKRESKTSKRASDNEEDINRLTWSNKGKFDEKSAETPKDGIEAWLDKDEMLRQQRRSSWAYNDPDELPNGLACMLTGGSKFTPVHKLDEDTPLGLRSKPIEHWPPEAFRPHKDAADLELQKKLIAEADERLEQWQQAAKRQGLGEVRTRWGVPHIKGRPFKLSSYGNLVPTTIPKEDRRRDRSPDSPNTSDEERVQLVPWPRVKREPNCKYPRDPAPPPPPSPRKPRTPWEQADENSTKVDTLTPSPMKPAEKTPTKSKTPPPPPPPPKNPPPPRRPVHPGRATPESSPKSPSED
ncbi:MAG: hypothetical protein MMC33_007679 [Icmadophila ericetorum]|nr:hypothetical protein [Icmadophila ericetorum]